MAMRKKLLALAAAATALGAASVVAASPTIEKAKSGCVVGEQADGYLGVVDLSKADAALTREVASVNQQRKAAYSNLAQSKGVTIEVAAALTAEKLINQAPSGQCVRDGSGSWIKKP
jgi:uncharacterized protein YdbL (DUF1318 family)